jgi:hypothetical protein
MTSLHVAIILIHEGIAIAAVSGLAAAFSSSNARNQFRRLPHQPNTGYL